MNACLRAVSELGLQQDDVTVRIATRTAPLPRTRSSTARALTRLLSPRVLFCRTPRGAVPTIRYGPPHAGPADRRRSFPMSTHAPGKRGPRTGHAAGWCEASGLGAGWGGRKRRGAQGGGVQLRGTASLHLSGCWPFDNLIRAAINSLDNTHLHVDQSVDATSNRRQGSRNFKLKLSHWDQQARRVQS